MDNKDQLNQIPGEENTDNRDEKTSQSENPKVEASPQDDQTQDIPNDQAKKNEPSAKALPDDPEKAEEAPVAATEAENTGPESEAVKSTENDGTPENEAQTQSTEEEVPTEVVRDAKPESEASLVEKEADTASSNPEVEKVAEVETPAENADATMQSDEKPEEIRIGIEPEPELPKAESATAEISKAETALVEISETETAMVESPAAKAKEVEAASEDTGEKAKADEPAAGAADEEDDDDEDEIVHEGEIIDYDALGREQLVDRLEALVGEDDVNKIKANVALIKVAYLKKTKEEKEALIDETLAKEKEEEKEDKEDKEEAEVPEVVEDKIEIRYRELFDIYKQKRAIYLENFEKQKLVNLQRKKDILEELKNLIGSEETLKKTYDDFRELQEAWKVVGMVPKGEVNNLWQNYHFLVEKFFDKVKINKELKDLDMKKNLEQKIELCEKAEELLLENSIIKSFKELQSLHDQWKEVGPVPTDKNEDLWERFKSTTDKINQRRRDHYKKLQDEHDNNYNAKTGLCEKAEQLLAEEVNSIREWQNKTRQFNELFKVWKTIGPASKKQNDEIWEKFKNILDAFFNEKKEYFGKLKDQQINNYNLKLDLCVRAEAIKDSDDWKQTTFDLIKFQKEWKNIGPVPRKHSDKIWKRFRSACDTFFERKNQHFSHIREDEADNLKKKEALIKQVEETVFDTDRSENLNKLKAFQREWTEIGFVPFKEKDRLQNEFRSAVDKQLDKLNISSSEISLDNYKSKMEVLKGSHDGNKSLGRERNFIQGKINQLRDDVNVWENNIGFLADTKQASLFKSEFEKKIVKAKKELEVLEEKLRFLNK